MDLNTEVIYRCELFKRLLDRDDESLSGIMSEETSDHILVAIVNALQREVCVCVCVCVVDLGPLLFIHGKHLNLCT